MFVAQQRVIRSKSSLYGDDGAQSNPAELDFHVESIISSNNSIGSTCISIANLKGVGPIGRRGKGVLGSCMYVSMIPF